MEKRRSLTTTEAHRLTGLSMNQLSNLCKHNRLKAEKLGRDWFIEPASLIEYIREWHPEIAENIEKEMESSQDG